MSVTDLAAERAKRRIAPKHYDSATNLPPPPHPPDSLTELAKAVDALLRRNPQRFDTMMGCWAEQQHGKPLSTYGPFAKLERGEPLVLEEMYAVAIAIHARTLPALADWYGADRPVCGDDGTITVDRPSLTFHSLARCVQYLSDNQLPLIEGIIERVKADLVQQQPTATKPAKKRRGRPSDTDHREDQRIFDIWESGSYSTYEALADELCTSDRPVTARDVRLVVNRHNKRVRREAETSAG